MNKKKMLMFAIPLLAITLVTAAAVGYLYSQEIILHGNQVNINGMLIRIPQVGEVIIGNNMEIDALSTVNSGTIEPTVIEDNVMISNHVIIAHNDIIKSGCIITGGSTVGGSVTIGKGSYLGINCSIKNGLTIGKNVLIGMGAVVRESTKDNVVVAGKSAKQYQKPIDY